MANEALDLRTARDAMRRGAWPEAVEAFHGFLGTQPEHAEALEQLGIALWWLDDQDPVLEAREHAFRVYREAGDLPGAARIATALALDYADYRGDGAVCNGWLQRAE